MLALRHKQRGFLTGIAATLGGSVVMYLIIAAIVLGAAGVIVYAIQNWGGDRVRAKLEPIIAKRTLERDEARGMAATLEADRDRALKANVAALAELDRLRALYAEQAQEMERLKSAATAAEARVREALRKVVATEKRYSAEIERLRAIAAGPTMTEGACDEADAILRALVRDRASGMR
jgi:CHASE3 domain sensor protein